MKPIANSAATALLAAALGLAGLSGCQKDERPPPRPEKKQAGEKAAEQVERAAEKMQESAKQPK